MKLFFLLSALVALTLAAPPASRALEDDINEILSLIPWVEIDAIVADFLQNDAEYQDAVGWLRGEEFAQLAASISGNADVQALVARLNNAGLDVSAALNALINILGGNGARIVSTQRGPRTMQEFIDTVTNIIPVNNLAALVLSKLQSSPDFQALFVTLQSPETEALFNAAWANADLQIVVAKLTSWGLDVQRIVDFLSSFLGWN